MRVSKGSLAIGAVIGLFVGWSGVAVATVAAESDEIIACVNGNGTVRIPQRPNPTPTSTSPQSLAVVPTGSPTPLPGGCMAGEKEISWNRTGPEGPTGPSGAVGPAGPKGEAGISGLQMVERTVTIGAHQQGDAVVTCPEGKLPLSGGYAYGRADHWNLEDNMLVGYTGLSLDPSTGKLRNTWGYRATNPNNWPVTVHTTALCAVLS
ncbi:hypothetical protein OG589_33695 [Sphaerisporangium sp. NBC_01403]|uniref:hypothetical protein n=1 Tax=Sphaerisporangium sp. NBC_01403 TaxID=2903599 RepID=UPI00324B5E42